MSGQRLSRKFNVYNFLIDWWPELKVRFDLKLLDLHLLLVLWRFADRDDLTCFPSLGRLACAIDRKDRATRNRIAKLERYQLITVRTRHYGGAQQSNEYSLAPMLALKAEFDAREAENQTSKGEHEGSDDVRD